MFGPYSREVAEAVEILKRTINVSLNSQDKLQGSEIKSKEDGTVVSITDFACQAIVMDGLQKAFPDDKVLGEETMTSISDEFLSSVKLLLPEGLDPVEACKDAVTEIKDEYKRLWVIDPIDGTYGFVQKGNYATAMALLIDKQTKVSAVAWPRHNPKYTGIPVDGPLIFVAAIGYGAYAVDLDGKFYPVKKAEHPENTITYSVMTKGTELTHQTYVKEKLGLANVIEMVSMTKGFVLGCGKAQVYMRLRCQNDEHVWDIAPFELFVREAGGFASTIDGKPLVYTQSGVTFNSKSGLFFTNVDEAFHQRVLDLYKESLNLPNC